MKVLVTGHEGYIGSVLVPMLTSQGHQVTGLDVGYYADCAFGRPPAEVPSLRIDLRDVEASHLRNFDAIIHLAALSNDPLGDLDPGLTDDINNHASIRLARMAKEAGVRRFLFSSSCSLYGVAGDDLLTESAPFSPVTPYAKSKVLVEQALDQLADASFSPTYLRNATAYGSSPRLRVDLVVNNLVGFAVTTGEVLIMSDGTPWRPLVHVEDISAAFISLMQAPLDVIHNQAVNIGSSAENYQVRDLAEMVRQTVPGSKVKYAGQSADSRCYRVDCSKLTRLLPNFKLRWTLRQGVQQLYDDYKANGLTLEEFTGPQYQRIKTIQKLQNEGRLDRRLRWTNVSSLTREAATL